MLKVADSRFHTHRYRAYAIPFSGSVTAIRCAQAIPLRTDARAQTIVFLFSNRISRDVHSIY